MNNTIIIERSIIGHFGRSLIILLQSVQQSLFPRKGSFEIYTLPGIDLRDENFYQLFRKQGSYLGRHS